MEKGFYHPNVGYWQTTSDPAQEILDSYPEGTVEVPVMPGPGYSYNGSEWVPPTQEWLDTQAAKFVRATRDTKLRREVDPVVTNPLRWADLSQEKQTEWSNYRKALLDITDQAGFPHEVVWPVKPT